MENYKASIRIKNSESIKSLLKKGMIPGIIYGKGTESINIVFEEKMLLKLMYSSGFYLKMIELNIDGKSEKVLPKQLQYHPVTDKLIHFDFLRVQENTKVTVEVPVEYLNQENCPGLKQGGVLNLVRRLVELSCKANQIPEKLQYDLIENEIGDAVKISDIDLPKGVTPIITDRNFVVATLVPPTIEIEEEKTKTEGEGEGEEEGVAEGEDKEKEEGIAEDKEKKEDQKEKPAENKSK